MNEYEDIACDILNILEFYSVISNKQKNVIPTQLVVYRCSSRCLVSNSNGMLIMEVGIECLHLLFI